MNRTVVIGGVGAAVVLLGGAAYLLMGGKSSTSTSDQAALEDQGPIKLNPVEVITDNGTNESPDGRTLTITFPKFDLNAKSGETTSAVFSTTWRLKLAPDERALVAVASLNGYMKSTAVPAPVLAPTPTAAAVLVTPSRQDLLAYLGNIQDAISASLRRRLDQLGERLDRTASRLLGARALLAPWREALLRTQGRLQRALLSLQPAQHARLNTVRQRLLQLTMQTRTTQHRVGQLQPRLDAALAGVLAQQRTRLQSNAQALLLLNPLNVLERGYALVFDDAGVPITDAVAAPPGTALSIRLKQGQIDATVVGTSARSRAD